MAQENLRYKALIAGKTYTFTNVESKEHMDILTDTFNDQLNDVLAKMPNCTLEQAFMMVAYNALSDQLKKEIRMKQIEAELEDGQKNLAELQSVLNETQASEEKLSKRLAKVNEIKAQARKALGDEAIDIEDPIEAQKIVNQQVLENIQNNQQNKV